ASAEPGAATPPALPPPHHPVDFATDPTAPRSPRGETAPAAAPRRLRGGCFPDRAWQYETGPASPPACGRPPRSGGCSRAAGTTAAPSAATTPAPPPPRRRVRSSTG